MIQALIIDDEPNAREVLNSMIRAYCPEVEVTGLAGNITDAYAMIQDLKPQLLFLDIEMQGETCFELIERFENPNFDVIFVTGYDNFVLKAIKFSALEYLLKPVNDVELINRVQKAMQKEEGYKLKDKLQNLITIIRNPYNKKNKIGIQTTQGIQMIEIDTIVRCEASGRYSILYLKDKRLIVTLKDLKSFQELLSDYGFYRIHDAHLISHTHIHKIVEGDEDVVITAHQERIPISRRRKKDFEEWLRRF
jgi:two-component system, LytTR family, response regulator